MQNCVICKDVIFVFFCCNVFLQRVLFLFNQCLCYDSFIAHGNAHFGLLVKSDRKTGVKETKPLPCFPLETKAKMKDYFEARTLISAFPTRWPEKSSSTPKTTFSNKKNNKRPLASMLSFARYLSMIFFFSSFKSLIF